MMPSPSHSSFEWQAAQRHLVGEIEQPRTINARVIADTAQHVAAVRSRGLDEQRNVRKLSLTLGVRSLGHRYASFRSRAASR
jgi:hypothetical protein